ncbi:AAA family ATPase [Campylobacter hyointestinalis]|uniref:AAA+ ATPase domain-containing protein n=1 Tax=Campylobacter hyointestinalis subsp. hyointestinalis TaxID=91352 RepID=A0A855N830_CAMHY|nr:AAA family ATPase [Campylobacter hyointestinalis]MDL2346172.1 AAA family ATPase [Campylobacter hyointestinalis]MDL2347912.1 AAA family ATPase [Campylobacter hyointestinalis]MDL2349655.1 AAA family ATPase [Campylobacter hyointestinalis]MDM1025670.1 AAA family ATPase [Campylobacter hyointestinalis]MDM1027661.1 AAA family ATPase [Campylobacter hyointestinalis]
MRELKGANAPRRKFDDILSYLSENKLTKEKLEMVKSEWLVENFIYKGSLVMIYASAGSGKSWFALALAKYILEQELLRTGEEFAKNGIFNSKCEVYYLNADNSERTLKNRNIEVLTKYDNFSLTPIKGENKEEVINKLAKSNLTNKIIIFDSIRNFMGDINFNDDSAVTRFMDKLQQMRDNGGTIIFLHHQPKQTDGENNKLYKGATAFADSVDEAYFLNKVEFDDESKFLSFCLEPQKRRDETKTLSCRVDTDFLNLLIMDETKTLQLSLNEKEKITIDLVCEILDTSGVINQGTLAKKLDSLAKDRAVEVLGLNSLWRLLNKFENIYFKIDKAKAKNQKFFSRI